MIKKTSRSLDILQRPNSIIHNSVGKVHLNRPCRTGTDEFCDRGFPKACNTTDVTRLDSLKANTLRDI